MTEENRSKSKSFLIGCGIAALIPIVLLILTAVIFTVNNRPIKISIPSHSVPKDNGLDWFVRAADAGKHLSPTSDTNGPNWTMADYKLFMKDNAACFAIQRQALTKPCVNSPSRGMTGMAMFKGSAKIRELARTLQGEAMYYEKMGDFEKAVDSQLDCVEMGVSMPNKGTLIIDLIAIGVESIGMRDIKRKLPKLNPDELAHAAARIEQIRKKRVPYSEIVMEEGYMNASNWIEIFNNRKTRQSLLDPRTWSQWSLSSGPPRYFDGVKFVFSNKTGIVNQILHFSEEMAAQAAKPYIGKYKVPLPSNPLMSMSCELLGRVWLTHLRSEANLSLLQTEIALRRYNADNGRYPNKLEQISPKYLKTVPIDLFGGKPLRYAAPLKVGKIFKLYSLGFNLIDDGGKPPIDKYDRESGDIVLGQED